MKLQALSFILMSIVALPAYSRDENEEYVLVQDADGQIHAAPTGAVPASSEDLSYSAARKKCLRQNPSLKGKAIQACIKSERRNAKSHGSSNASAPTQEIQQDKQ